MKIGFISLGCSKNLVDTEMAIGLFQKHNYQIVNDPSKADMIIINTCGFIDSAKEEAIQTIFEMVEYKKKACKYIVAMGCLVKRYEKELKKEIPEVDLWVSADQYDHFWEEIERLIGKNKEGNHTNTSCEVFDYHQRTLTTGNTMAYLKIAEGCSNHCTYCAIPSIRGPFMSRKMEDILIEAKELAQKGIKEIIVIAQDTTKYGVDLYGEPKLAKLLQELCKIQELEWIRFLYAYPESITDELIQVVKEEKKICHYFDIPIQHISDSVLKRMNRKSDGASIRNLMKKIRTQIPDVILRTTFIVGFPGETKEDFEKLYQFVKEIEFDRLGAFPYSKEEGTPAEKLPEQIHASTKKSRYRKIMELQQSVVEKKLAQKIGNIYRVLIEDISFDKKYYIARSYMDVPEMDGVIYIKNEEEQLLMDQFIDCKITEVKNYDLIGEIVK